MDTNSQSPLPYQEKDAATKLRELTEFVSHPGYATLQETIDGCIETAVENVTRVEVGGVASMVHREQVLGGIKYMRLVKQLIPTEIKTLQMQVAEEDTRLKEQLKQEKAQNEGPIELNEQN